MQRMVQKDGVDAKEMGSSKDHAEDCKFKNPYL